MATYLIIVFQILPLDGGTLSKLHSPTLHVTSWWPHFALYNTCMQYLAILALHWLTMTMVMIRSHCMWPLGDPLCNALCNPPVLNHKSLHCKLWRMMKYTPHPTPPDPLHTHCVLAKRFELWPCLAILASSCVGSLRRSGKISFLSNWQKWDRDSCQDVDREDSEW